MKKAILAGFTLLACAVAFGSPAFRRLPPSGISQVLVVEGEPSGEPALTYTSYVTLVRSEDDYITTPDSAQNSTAGSMEIIIKCSLPDWTPADASTILAGKGAAGGSASWVFRVYSDGNLILGITTDGTNYTEAVGDIVATFTNGTAGWLRCTYDGTANQVKFYKAADAGYPASWTQLGATKTLSIGTTYNSTGPLRVGEISGSTNNASGNFYHFELYDGLVGSGGTLVARFNAGDGTSPTYNNVSGQTAWTNSGGTPGP